MRNQDKSIFALSLLLLALTVEESTRETGGPGIGSWLFSYALSNDGKTLTLTGITPGVTGMVITFTRR